VVNMPKNVSLPLQVYQDLVKVSEELSLMAKKSISISMTVNLLMEVYRAHLNNPCALDVFSRQMQSPILMSSEEFDRCWDEPKKEYLSKCISKSRL
jgi:hypothetical protein